MKKIGYYSYNPNPWIRETRKQWQHHHHIFRIINSDIDDLEIHPIVRPTAYANRISKLENGDNSVLMEGFQNIKFVFHEEYDTEYNDYDALFLEPGYVCLMYKENTECESKYEEIIKNKIIEAKERNIPILWYDGDADLVQNSHRRNFARNLFYSLNMNDYDKCTVVGPYEDCKGNIKNFKFVPYNIDFDILPSREDIRDESHRDILTTYIGNEYFRKSFYPHLNEISKYGTVKIIGSFWDKEKFSPNVDLNKSQRLSEGDFKDYYDRSLFGLYGDNDLLTKFKHYTLRVCEYLRSGIYIIPDNHDYIVSKFGNSYTIEDLYNEDRFRKLYEDLENNYVDMVLSQREKLKDTFDSRNYVDVYVEALGI